MIDIWLETEGFFFSKMMFLVFFFVISFYSTFEI